MHRTLDLITYVPVISQGMLKPHRTQVRAVWRRHQDHSTHDYFAASWKQATREWFDVLLMLVGLQDSLHKTATCRDEATRSNTTASEVHHPVQHNVAWATCSACMQRQWPITRGLSIQRSLLTWLSSLVGWACAGRCFNVQASGPLLICTTTEYGHVARLAHKSIDSRCHLQNTRLGTDLVGLKRVQKVETLIPGSRCVSCSIF